MKDKEFKKMDEAWMKKMKPLREKEVSEGLLKGFSASVERRLTPAGEAPARKTALRPVWIPTLAVLVLASAVVLRSPVSPTADDDVQEEIEVLRELGVWDEASDEAVLGEEAVLADDDMEKLLTDA